MNIAITSYRRPELTKVCLENLVQLNGIANIFIFIDGLRSGANNLEEEWRCETIRVCEALTELHSKITLVVWESNIGIVENSKRSFTPLFEKFHEIIVLEEDVHFTQEGLNFLTTQLLENKSKLATSYSHFDHLADNKIARKTLFPTLWGAGYTGDLFELSMKIHRDQVLDQDLITEILNDFLIGDFLYKRRLIKFWKWYFGFAVKSGRHPDVLLQYASWQMNCFASAPTSTYSEDLSRLDFRGMNPRVSENSRLLHESNYSEGFQSDFCSICERYSSRIEPSSIRHYGKSLMWRLRSSCSAGQSSTILE